MAIVKEYTKGETRIRFDDQFCKDVTEEEIAEKIQRIGQIAAKVRIKDDKTA